MIVIQYTRWICWYFTHKKYWLIIKLGLYSAHVLLNAVSSWWYSEKGHKLLFSGHKSALIMIIYNTVIIWKVSNIFIFLVYLVNRHGWLLFSSFCIKQVFFFNFINRVYGCEKVKYTGIQNRVEDRRNSRSTLNLL